MARSKACYDKDFEKSHFDAATCSKDHYEKDIETSHTLKRQRYVLLCVCSLMIICIIFRYSLKPPSNSMIDYYVDNVFNNLITSDAVDKEVIMKKVQRNLEVS